MIVFLLLAKEKILFAAARWTLATVLLPMPSSCSPRSHPSSWPWDTLDRSVVPTAASDDGIVARRVL